MESKRREHVKCSLLNDVARVDIVRRGLNEWDLVSQHSLTLVTLIKVSVSHWHQKLIIRAKEWMESEKAV